MAYQPLREDDHERIAKLPRGAQQLIFGLIRQRDDAKKLLAEYQTGTLEDPKKQLFYTTDILDREKGAYWLPKYSRLSFRNGPEIEEDRPDLEISTARDGLSGIEIRAPWRGKLAIFPVVTNTIRITTIEG
jgi:hypothetical protein